MEWESKADEAEDMEWEETKFLTKDQQKRQDSIWDRAIRLRKARAR